MPNTYSEMFVHVVFTPKGRKNLLTDSIRERVFKYMAGIIIDKKQKPYIVNGMPDHVHIFFSYSPDISVSNLVRDIKSSSCNFINNNKLIPGKFEWQLGFGSFSYSTHDVPKIVNYIKNQEEHHKKKTFREEYIEFLTELGIEFDKKYLFEFYEDEN